MSLSSGYPLNKKSLSVKNFIQKIKLKLDFIQNYELFKFLGKLYSA